MSSQPGDPVLDWGTDHDLFDPGYVEDPFPIWDELRQTCPVSHSERYGPAWLPTKYDDVVAMARLVPELSSDSPTVVPLPEPDVSSDDPSYGVKAPPISSDPPEHGWARRLILPFFSQNATAGHQPYVEALAHQLIDEFADRGTCDGAVEYAQQIPPRMIAKLLGVPEERSADFTEWVRGLLELGLTDDEIRKASREKLMEFLFGLAAERATDPGDDVLSVLLHTEVEGEPITPQHLIGTVNLLVIAGIDTTWSSIGSALWHLAKHPADRERLVAEPELIPTAVEELLRAYSPVTMGRVVTEEVEVAGVTMQPGDKVVMNFPAANRDPEAFDRPDEVIIDRERNRHVAFGVGIHRCAGSNLARMEMQVAIRVFLERIPDFELADPSAVTWAGGQVRGPRQLPLKF